MKTLIFTLFTITIITVGLLSDIRGSVIRSHTTPFSFRLCAKNLPSRDRSWFSTGISDPYVIITYRDRSGTEKPIHQTAALTNNANPTWPETIEFSKYEPNRNQILIFRFYDCDTISRDFLGEAFVDADSLVRKSGKVTIPLQRSDGNAAMILQMPNHELTTSQPKLTTSQPRLTTTQPRLTTTQPKLTTSHVPTTETSYGSVEEYDYFES